ncbi:MAG: glycosyltransferase family 4 protein [Promethearchaeota archaeon]
MIINATNIGRRLTGIGRYSLSLSHYFLEHWDYPFRLFIDKRALVHFVQTVNKNKITIVDGNLSSDFGFRGHLIRLLWTNKLCIQNKTKLIFNTSQLEGCLFHKKQIITVHDLIPLITQGRYKKQYFYFKYLLPLIMRNSARILTGSHHTKHLIMKFYKIPEQKITVIPYGVNILFLNKTPQQKKMRYILYVGRLSPEKNVEGLIKAFEIIIRKFDHDIILKLTGDEKQLNFIITKNVRNKLEFVGHPNDENLIELYRNALLFVFPSFYEGFGLPPLEAMACGCPVVISNVASLPEVCGDAAYYVDPNNIESIAEGIYKVLTDEALRKSMIEKGLQRAKLLSWEKSAREHIKVFEEVVNSIHSPSR